jgi:hypothetical protein
MIIGILGIVLGAVPGAVGGTAVGTAVPFVGNAVGAVCGPAAAAAAGASIGEIINIIAGCGIPGSFINSILVFPSLCQSLWHNLIWIICGGPIVIRAAYMDNCMAEFLKACFELIRHLMGG